MPKLDHQIRQTNDITGGSITSDDPCEHIRFSNQQAALNPTEYRRYGTEEDWQEIADKCPGETFSAPVELQNVLTNPDEQEQDDGDSGAAQGIPDPEETGLAESISEVQQPTAPTEEPTRPPDGEQHPTHGGEQPQQQTDAGDPVDIFNGALYLQETDLEIPNTVLPLTFSRFYRSGEAAYGPLGWNWDHNHNRFVRELQNGDIALWRNLHEDVYVFDGANFKPPRGKFERLVRVPGLAQVFEVMGIGGTTMRYERPAGWIDGERIPIIWVKDRHGNQLSYSYGSEDKLIEVVDDDGRFIRFEYDQCGLLVSVYDHSGRKYTYKHNQESQHLFCVCSPSTTDHPEAIARIYHYEKPFTLPELRHNIIRVEDSKGNVYLENKYEQDPASWHYARITEQLYGGFLYQFRYTQLQWVPANPVYVNIPAVRVEVLNPDFGLEIYTFSYRGDLLDRRYRLNKDKSFRVVVWQYGFDEQGNLSINTKPDGSQEIRTYDHGNPDPRMRGNLLKVELTSASGFPSPSRIIWKGKYESTYQLMTEETNELAATTDYKYDFNIHPGAPTNSGNLLEIHEPDVTLPDATVQSSITKLEYNSKGQATALVQADGVRHEFTYGNAGDEKSRLIKQTFDVGGLAIENIAKYDAFGYQKEFVDGNGHTAKEEFNALGLLEKCILPSINGFAPEFRFHYDSDHFLVASERPKGNYSDAVLTEDHIRDRVERNVLGYPKKYFLSDNSNETREVDICSDFRGFSVETTNPDRSKIKQTFDERGLLVREEIIGTDSTALIAKHVYDRAGKLVQEINEQGHVTKYVHDGFSRISHVEFPNGTETLWTWGKGNLIESETVTGDGSDGNTRVLSVTMYTYDEKGRRIKETVKSFENDPAMAVDVTTTIYYDQMDRVEKVIDARGGIGTIEYDAVGRAVKVVDPMGNEEHFGYDNNGNTISRASHQKEPDGSMAVISKSFTFDARNRMTEEIEPDGAKTVIEYDDRDLVVKKTDLLGVVSEAKFNTFDDIFEGLHDVGGLNIRQQWTVDNMSRITSYVDPTGEVSKYQFDGIGRTSKMVYPNGSTSTITFNSNGQISGETLASGVKLTFDYDAAGRLKSVENPVAPAPVVPLKKQEYGYDGLDRLVSAKSGADEVKRAFDSQSRLLSETALGTTMRSTFNDATGAVRKIWADGRTEKYSYDLDGVVTKIVETAGGILGNGATPIASFKPSGNNYFGEATYQGGIKLVNQYDERKRLVETAVNSAAGLNETFEYRYDTGNRKRVEGLLGQNSKISLFEFDGKNRLSNAKDGFATPISNANTQAEHDAAIAAVHAASAGATHEEEFKYDDADARTKYLETGAPSKNYTYLSGHRIQSDGTNLYTHHTDGTLQSDGQFTYITDALGRIVEVNSGPNTVCKIAYDAYGRPSTLEETGKPKKTFNYLGRLIEQENENGVASRHITTHPATGIPIAYHGAGTTHYPLFDNRFNLVALTDAGGKLVETYRYKAFGEPLIFDAAGINILGSNFGNDPIFGGQRFLPSTGLYLSKSRLMNPVNGLYLAVDPFGYADSPSLYVYVSQNPVDLIDPEGELAILATILIGAAIGAAISAYANRNKKGADFWVAVGAGAVAGGIMGTGYGLVSFAAGGAAGGLIQGGYEGYKQGGVGGAVKGGLTHGAIGAVGGLVGGAIGGRAATAVSGRLYGTLIGRTVSPAIARVIGSPKVGSLLATQVSQYTGVGVGGATGGYYAGISQSTLSLAASGKNPIDHPGVIMDSSLEGAGYGLFGGVSSKALIQGYGYYKTNTVNGMLGAEGEFSVQSQTRQKINTDTTVPNVNGNPRHAKIPDLHGRVMGDVKNTAKIPSLNAQNRQLASILAAARARGQRMSLFHRPGVTSGPRSQVNRAGDIDLIPIRPFTPPLVPIQPNEIVPPKK